MGERLTWFTYTEIKFIPDPVKDEAVNVGVLVVDEKGNTASKFIDNFDHIAKNHSIGDVDLLEMILPAYGNNKDRDPKYLDKLHHESVSNHRIKIPSPHAVRSSSLDAAVDRIYSQMISIPDRND